MTITPEKLKRMRECTSFDMPADAQIELLDHINAQAARIAELESASPSALKEKLRSAESRISELEKEIARRDAVAGVPVAVPDDCSHEWISSEGRTTSGWLCNRCGDYNGPAPVAVPDGLRLALSNAGIAAPESDEEIWARKDEFIQRLVNWVRDKKPVSVPRREDFEAWFSDCYKHPKAVERSGEYYCLLSARTNWDAWQACVESFRRLNSGSGSDE